jgi:hypothetical protein
MNLYRQKLKCHSYTIPMADNMIQYMQFLFVEARFSRATTTGIPIPIVAEDTWLQDCKGTIHNVQDPTFSVANGYNDFLDYYVHIKGFNFTIPTLNDFQLHYKLTYDDGYELHLVSDWFTKENCLRPYNVFLPCLDLEKTTDINGDIIGILPEPDYVSSSPVFTYPRPMSQQIYSPQFYCRVGEFKRDSIEFDFVKKANRIMSRKMAKVRALDVEDIGDFALDNAVSVLGNAKVFSPLEGKYYTIDGLNFNIKDKSHRNIYYSITAKTTEEKTIYNGCVDSCYIAN